LVLFAGPVIANGISQPKPAVSGIGGRRLEFDGKLVIAGREVQVAFDIRARLDGSCSDQGIDIEPPCALNRRPSALSSATITAHFSGPSSFVLDGEAVLLGVDGRSDFNGLHSRRHDHEVEFYAFDILVSDGEDLRKLPLSMRKASLARLLARRVDGIFLSDFEQGEIGPDLFRHACLMGLEGHL
jgi:anaerobic glycerol-3-phosphate dehydrogenase